MSAQVATSSSSHESVGTAVANIAGWQLEPLPPYGRCRTTGESIGNGCRAGSGAAAAVRALDTDVTPSYGERGSLDREQSKQETTNLEAANMVIVGPGVTLTG